MLCTYNSTRLEMKHSTYVMCQICYEEMHFDELTRLKCTHRFHTHCLEHWSRDYDECKICGEYIEDETNVTNKN